MRFVKISACYIFVLVFLSVSTSVYSCEIGVALPLEAVTYMPGDSSLQINCTVYSTNEEVAWSIHLTNPSSVNRFKNEHSNRLLNSRGFFQLTEVNTETNKTIRLIVNSTAGNNGTLVQCFYPGRAIVVSETTLFIYEIVPISLKKHDIHLHTTNVSWNSVQLIPGAVLSFYTLSVANTSTFIQSVELQDTHYTFAAYEGAPPCEIYNFSVTAIYNIITGTTYTGTDCSISSSVLSTMLPTLPEIDNLESTLKYSLEKSLNGDIILRTTFLPAGYCEEYPVIKYTLKVRGPSTLLSIDSEKPSISVDSLLEDLILEFSVSAINSLGAMSSNEITIYTTDVQSVTMTPVIGSNVAKIQCDFIPGSNAQGCMVVIVGQSGNTTVKLMRKSNHVAVLCLTNSSSKNYKHVVGFDIESDGSIGTVVIPGYLEKASADPAVTCKHKSGSAILLACDGILLNTLVLVALLCNSRNPAT